MAFLNETGLQRLWEQINAHFKKLGTTVELTISVPTTGWTLNETYNAYTQSFTATGITTDMDLYVDCAVGASFPIVGARCTTANSVMLYMSDVPTIAQDISLKGVKEG